MVTRDDIATLIYLALSGDATMKDAIHLNGEGKISKSVTRPPKSANPTLTIDVIPEIVLGDSKTNVSLARIVFYLDNFPDGDTDHPRAKRIESRIGVLMDEKRLTGVAGIRNAQCLQNGHARILFDPASPSETAWVNDYRLWTS